MQEMSAVSTPLKLQTAKIMSNALLIEKSVIYRDQG